MFIDKWFNPLNFSSHPEISSSVAEYVYRATSCFVYKKFNMIKEFNEAFAKVKDVNFSSLKDKSTIDACRSIAWSKYHQIGTKNAEKFIRQALDNNPKCDLYCFILAKNLRRQRRNNCIDSKPGAEEVDNFTKAYKLSKNQVYELFVAQMHREAGEMNKSKKIYEKIFYSDSKSNTVLLRLALGFIRLREFRKAEVCLDQVKGKNPNQSMYLHYRGIYLMKQKRFKVNNSNFSGFADYQLNILIFQYIKLLSFRKLCLILKKLWLNTISALKNII